MSVHYYLMTDFEINNTLQGLRLTSLIPFPDPKGSTFKPNYPLSKPQSHVP